MPNNSIIIETPRAVMISTSANGASIQTRIEWKPGFGREWTSHLQQVQGMFDMEVLRRTEPYVPFDTGMLAHSPIMASDIGGGLLVWNTPYAAHQYHQTSDSRLYDPLRGAHWGERMKADNLEALAQFVRRAVAAK